MRKKIYGSDGFLISGFYCTCIILSEFKRTHVRPSCILNRCEVDRNTHIISQSTHETTFVFQDFEYDNNPEGLEIQCKATFCETSDYSPSCTQACTAGPIVVG